MKTDILVIGSGIAGLYFALKCSRFAQVTLATKDGLKDSNTSKAQGGIAAVMNSTDSPVDHYNDTITAGDGLCNETAVKYMVNEGPGCINDLINIGVQFTRNENGELQLSLEGGHNAERVVHIGDQTGAGLVHPLSALVKSNPFILLKEHCFAIDLWVENGVCLGAYFIDEVKGETFTVHAKSTFMATGGAGRLYTPNTNPSCATGDGFAMAWRAGARMQNMEFIQFHPTVLYSTDNENFLISEAVRGFGAELVNVKGEKFMSRYHPMGSLAPRDIVTRAIVKEMKIDGTPCVYLEIPQQKSKEFVKRFPSIYSKCLQKGVDFTKQHIPVVPAAHYMCGGVEVDLFGTTNLPGLYVCGETACTGVHGANRLASNSLLEGLVFANATSNLLQTRLSKPGPTAHPMKHLTSKVTSELPERVIEMRNILPEFMWQNAGIIRNEILLESAHIQLDKWGEELKSISKKHGINRGFVETLNLVQTAKIVVLAALKRKESRGTHYRSDYPEHREQFLAPTIIQNTRDENLIYQEVII